MVYRCCQTHSNFQHLTNKVTRIHVYNQGQAVTSDRKQKYNKNSLTHQFSSKFKQYFAHLTTE